MLQLYFCFVKKHRSLNLAHFVPCFTREIKKSETMILSLIKRVFKGMQDIFTALCGRWWLVKVRFAGFLLALPLQIFRKASVEQLQVRVRA